MLHHAVLEHNTAQFVGHEGTLVDQFPVLADRHELIRFVTVNHIFYFVFHNSYDTSKA